MPLQTQVKLLRVLEERKEDLPLLAEPFRKDFRKLHCRDIDGMDREVLKTFAQHGCAGR